MPRRGDPYIRGHLSPPSHAVNGPVLLRLEGIEKRFGAVRALRGVSFDLAAGEVHALLGENGAGKSTLIKVLTGAHAPDAGRIVLEGVEHRAMTPGLSRSLGIACVYQQPALFQHLTVLENLVLRLDPARPLRRFDWTRAEARAREWLGRIGCGIDPRRTVDTLSMPEQQLVEISAAVGAEAKVVVFDEPTASLTSREQQRLHETVRGLRARGVGVIYISHRLEEVFALADRVTVLRDGGSVGTSRVDEVDEAGLIERVVGRGVDLAPVERRSGPGAVRLDVEGLTSSSVGIRDVSLQVRAGEVVCLAGMVGSGRTELARVLFGLESRDSGAVRIDGRELDARTPVQAMDAGLALVPEDRRRQGVVLEMPVSQNLALARHRRLFPGGWLRPTAERSLATRLIELLGIKTAGPSAPVSSLSGGNQQKVSVGRWLAIEPGVLILDEPTQGVDVGAKDELHREIAALADRGMAVLMISSDLPELLRLADRIGVMRRGSLCGWLERGATAAEVMRLAMGATATDRADSADEIGKNNGETESRG